MLEKIVIQTNQYGVILLNNVFHSKFLSECFNKLQHELIFPINRSIIRPRTLEPRDVLYLGDSNVADYRYANNQLHSIKEWTPTTRLLKDKIEEKFQSHNLLAKIWKPINCVLINQYKDEKDSMGLHADDEYILTGQKIIISLSLGETRTMIFQNISNQKKIRINIQSGTVIIMYGSILQDDWKHGIEKNKELSSLRLNLSFRHHYQRETHAIFQKLAVDLSSKLKKPKRMIQKILSSNF